jgi:hypothetical protein
VYSGTHDPKNNTRYYRWDYDEAWVVYSYFDSHLETVTIPKDSVVERPTQDEIDSCWISGHSSTLVLNSSAKLSQDIITDNPVAFVSSASEKLVSAYSILLRQYALTEDAFNYWQNLKTNTEQLGSIFDAQPSQIQGNIHCTSNPSEPVLGYIGGGVVTKKRIFVYKNALPGWRQVNPYDAGCILDTLALPDLPRLFETTAIPVDGIYNAHVVLIGYSIAVSRTCVDCTVRGTNRKPIYWISK